MALPTKEVITEYLRQNNIAVPQNTSYVQLKIIYDEMRSINQGAGAIPKRTVESTIHPKKLPIKLM